MPEAVRTATDHRQDWLLSFGEASMRLCRPLHRRPRATALGEFEIVAHPDFIAVADDRRARQCQHETIGELHPAAVSIEHGCEPAPDAPFVELHLGLGPKGREYGLALFVGEPPEIELIVVA